MHPQPGPRGVDEAADGHRGRVRGESGSRGGGLGVFGAGDLHDHCGADGHVEGDGADGAVDRGAGGAGGRGDPTSTTRCTTTTAKPAKPATAATTNNHSNVVNPASPQP